MSVPAVAARETARDLLRGVCRAGVGVAEYPADRADSPTGLSQRLLERPMIDLPPSVAASGRRTSPETRPEPCEKHERGTGMSVTVFRRPPRWRAPEMPSGELSLQEPPSLSETLGVGSLSMLFTVMPMAVGVGAMLLMVVIPLRTGGGFGGGVGGMVQPMMMSLMMGSMMFMGFGQFARGGGERRGRLRGIARRAVRLAALPALVLAGMAAGPVAAAAAAPGSVGPDGTQCVPAVNDVFRQLPWAQQRLAPERAWMLTRGGSVTVAVLDTGVSRSAPALAGRVLPGRDVRTGGPADSDCAGHGTFVAGLIAARPVGATPFAGVAPDARILPIRVADEGSDVHPDLLAKGIQAAVQGGATVIAVVATAPFGSPALRQAVALADERGAIVVASAATMRGQQGDVAYPAALPGVVSVIGIGQDGRPAATGTASRPTLAAPGANLVSVPPAGDGNVQGSGVNLGVAFVAGAAALVRGYLPALPASAVRTRLTTTADPFTAADPSVGSGVVDPVAAITAVLPAANEHPPAPPRPQPVVLPPTPVIDHRPARAAVASAAE